MVRRPPRMATGVARRMSERARDATGDAPSIATAGGFAGMVDALRGMVRQLADAAQAAGEAARAEGRGSVHGSGSRTDGAGQFSIGEGNTRVVFGYRLRSGPDGVSAKPFGHVPPAPAADPRGSRRDAAAAVRQPIVDVFEDGGTVVVVAELPGADPASITCQPQGSMLLIEASGSQTYSKAIALPAPVGAAGLVKSFRHGILEVRLEKAPAR